MGRHSATRPENTLQNTVGLPLGVAYFHCKAGSSSLEELLPACCSLRHVEQKTALDAAFCEHETRCSETFQEGSTPNVPTVVPAFCPLQLHILTKL